MFISDEVLSIWKPQEEEKRKSPLEKQQKKRNKKPHNILYNGKNHKRRIK